MVQPFGDGAPICATTSDTTQGQLAAMLGVKQLFCYLLAEAASHFLWLDTPDGLGLEGKVWPCADQC